MHDRSDSQSLNAEAGLYQMADALRFNEADAFRPLQQAKSHHEQVCTTDLLREGLTPWLRQAGAFRPGKLTTATASAI